MKLIEQIKQDRIEAFKKRDIYIEKVRKNVLSCLISDSCKNEKDPDDSKVMSMIKKFIDNAKFIKEKTEVGSFEFNQAQTEIDILENYVPTQLTEREIKTLLANMTLPNVELNIGMIMKFFKTNFEGQYDGAMVSKIAKEFLG